MLADKPHHLDRPDRKAWFFGIYTNSPDKGTVERSYMSDDSFTDKLKSALEGENVDIIEETDKVKVGDKEYTQEELSQLVGLGEIGRELETKWNTKIDKIYPEYTKTQQNYKDLETKAKEYEAKLKEIEAKKQDLPEDQVIAQAREAAKKVGLLTNDDFNPLLEKSFRQFYVQERAAERLLEEVKGFEGKIDGKDGRPAFVAKDILEYMQENSISNPETAYKLKFENEIDAWKEAQLGKIKKPGMTTIDSTTAGAKQPPKANINRDNLGEAIREALYPNND